MPPKEYSHAVWVAIDVCIRLGLRIRTLREQRGWTQTYLAVHTGLGRAFISDLENGKKEPCLRSLEILAAGFQLSLSQLFSRLAAFRYGPFSSERAWQSALF